MEDVLLELIISPIQTFDFIKISVNVDFNRNYVIMRKNDLNPAKSDFH